MLWCRFEIEGRPRCGIVEGDGVTEVCGDPFSERDWQKSDPTNLCAKNCDTFKPMVSF